MDRISIGDAVMDCGTLDMFGVKIMLICAGKGALGCGYINLEAAEKFHHALAIVSGVSSYDDMLAAEVKAVSSLASAMGIVPGMSGRAALEKMN